MTRIAAVIFDLDGTLTDSEHWWDEVRRQLAADQQRPWPATATAAMMGMSTPEWAAYMVDVVGCLGPHEHLAQQVIAGMTDRYRAGVPLLPGADRAVRRIAARWPAAICSSSPRAVIEAVVATMGWGDLLPVRVSTEQVARGKPHPDGHLRTAELLAVEPARCVVIEDAPNGIRAAIAAGMKVVAVPPHFNPPGPELLATADLVIDSLDALIIEAIAGLG